MKTIQQTTFTTSRKLGMNKGKLRLWIEGSDLLINSWFHGDKFNIEYHQNKVTYTKDVNGKRKVAGKIGRPIIDTNTDKLQILGNGTVFISITANQIVITKN